MRRRRLRPRPILPPSPSRLRSSSYGGQVGLRRTSRDAPPKPWRRRAPQDDAECVAGFSACAQKTTRHGEEARVARRLEPWAKNAAAPLASAAHPSRREALGPAPQDCEPYVEQRAISGVDAKSRIRRSRDARA